MACCQTLLSHLVKRRQFTGRVLTPPPPVSRLAGPHGAGAAWPGDGHHDPTHDAGAVLLQVPHVRVAVGPDDEGCRGDEAHRQEEGAAPWDMHGLPWVVRKGKEYGESMKRFRLVSGNATLVRGFR